MLFCGHPSALAIGSQVAITIGERTREGALGTSALAAPSPPCVSAQRSLITAMSREEAGDQTAAVLAPLRMASIDSADPSATASMRMGAPARVRGPVLWNASIESLSQAFFSDP